MLFNNILATVATACAVFAPAAMAADMKARKASKADCSGGTGPVREFKEGACHGLYSSDRGIKIVEYASGCKMRGYKNGNCQGSPITAFNTKQCHSLKNVWSVKVGCS